MVISGFGVQLNEGENEYCVISKLEIIIKNTKFLLNESFGYATHE